jgi:hypothetical protein
MQHQHLKVVTMNMMILVPKVVRNYIGEFPETTHNAYKYFNYDKRVVSERAETRFDNPMPFKGPQDLTNEDFDTLVKYAKTLLNPILSKYDPKLACEDALHIAIKSYDRGVFDGKINANRYNVLVQAMLQPEQPVQPMVSQIPGIMPPVMAKKKEAPKEKQVSPRTLKELGVNPKKVLLDYQTRHMKGPHFVKAPGKGIVVRDKKSSEDDGVAPNEYLSDFLNLISQLPTKDIDVVRKLVGRWKQAKPLVGQFLQSATKDAGIDPAYAQKVADDFKTASAIMDKLAGLYDNICDFSMDDIKTHFEPLQELIEKVKGKGQEPEQAPEPSEGPAEVPENTEENQPE